MSSDVVIKVADLGKRYRIRHQQRERYTALRDVLARKFAAPFKRLRQRSAEFPPANDLMRPPARSAPPPVEDFWALKEVNFEVKRGEVVGIIGRNGAGKSTLLKILSRITEPTVGEVQIRGRIASLLEVGTGFHPELTGRENIFLNGAILGMTRAEICRKFDEIIEFAEVEKFLDTPVKRYSSGMYVRLAFAVAAHLEPEILIVDEVLAVGDAQFQEKCLGKMHSVSAREGRTVLFVSHNMSAIRALCSRSIHFRGGMLARSGQTEAVIEEYLRDRPQAGKNSNQIRFAGAIAELLSFKSAKVNGERVTDGRFELLDSQTLQITVRYSFRASLSVACAIYIFSEGVRVMTVHDYTEIELTAGEEYESRYEFPRNSLRNGIYQVAFGGFEIGREMRDFWNDEIFQLSIVGNDPRLDPKGLGFVNLDVKVSRLPVGSK